MFLSAKVFLYWCLVGRFGNERSQRVQYVAMAFCLSVVVDIWFRVVKIKKSAQLYPVVRFQTLDLLFALEVMFSEKQCQMRTLHTSRVYPSYTLIDASSIGILEAYKTLENVSCPFIFLMNFEMLYLKTKLSWFSSCLFKSYGVRFLGLRPHDFELWK